MPFYEPSVYQLSQWQYPLQQLVTEYQSYYGRTITSHWGSPTSFGTAAVPPAPFIGPLPYQGVTLAAPILGAIPIHLTRPFYYGVFTFLSRFSTGAFVSAQDSTTGSRIVYTPMLVDRLWHSNQLPTNTTSTTSILSDIFPPRGIYDPSTASGTFRGIYVAMASWPTTPTGSNYAPCTITYTNSNGVTGRTGTSISMTNAPTYSMDGIHIFSLEGNDEGVSQVETFTLGTTLASNPIFYLFAFRPICILNMKNSSGNMSIDDFTSLVSPWIYAGLNAASVLQVLYLPADILPAGTSFTPSESVAYGGPMEIQLTSGIVGS